MKNRYLLFATAIVPVVFSVSCVISQENRNNINSNDNDNGTISEEKPNIVLILTDDQRFDTATPEYMPNLHSLLVSQGNLYLNAIITNPVCCPSRAALLSGGFRSKNNHVLTNEWPSGSARRFVDTNTISVQLQNEGYRTALVGKYMNGFKRLKGQTSSGDRIKGKRYVPPGWDLFCSPVKTGDWNDYTITIGTSDSSSPNAGLYLPKDDGELDDFMGENPFSPLTNTYLENLDYDNLPYITHLEREASLTFIQDSIDAEEPFFIYISCHAPHGPATPEPQYEDLYPNFEYRGRGWGASQDSKPFYVSDVYDVFEEYYDGSVPFDSKDDRNPDEWLGDQIRALRSVDDLIASVYTLVQSDPVAFENTWFIFYSDNGYMVGEHQIFRKKLPYDESIRTPLVIKKPGTNDPQTFTDLVEADLDVGATILDIAGIESISDGESLVSGSTSKEAIFSQSYRKAPRFPGWAVAKDLDWTYIYYDTQEFELYNNVDDPFQENNLVFPTLNNGSDYDEIINDLHQKLEPNMGMHVFGIGLDEDWVIQNFAEVGVPFSFTYTLRNSVGNVTWQQFDDKKVVDKNDSWIDRIPDGLTLNSDGSISGTPTESGDFEFFAEVIDSYVSPYNGLPQRYINRCRIRINP